MRYLRYVLVIVFCFCVFGCYEVNEEIIINEDGSGTYSAKMDMGQLIDMMQTFAGEEELNKEGMDRVVDTIVMMKDIADPAEKMNAENKELVKDGKMHLQMNIKEKIFKIDFDVPYKNYSSLQKLMEGQGGSGMGVSSLFKNMFGGKQDQQQADSSVKEPNMDEFSKIYEVTVKDGLLSRVVNKEKYKALMDRPEMAQMKELTSSGIEILYTTTFKLPRPVKKSDNPLVKLSDNKQTVTLKYNLLEALDNPDKFSYTIEY